MRHQSFLSIGLVSALLWTGCTAPRTSEKKPLPVTAPELAGTWVGLTEDGIYYFRIELEAHGKGRCAYVYHHDKATLLAIDEWSTEAGKIKVRPSPIDPDPNQIASISGSAHASIIDASVLGKGWRRNLVLRREDDLELRARLAKDRMIRDKESRN